MICTYFIRCIFSWVNFDRISKSCHRQFQTVVEWSPWPYPCVTCGKEEFFFCDGGMPTEGRQLIVYESRPSPLLFKGSCYVLVLVSAGVYNALVANTVGLLAHLVYHHHHRDYNATKVVYTYTVYYIKNQQDVTLAVLFISNCKITLHVSDAFCVHHQEY